MKTTYPNLIKLTLIIAALALFAAITWVENAGTLAQVAQPSQTPAPPAFDQPKAIADLMAQIKGREQEPAEKVFKNIQTFKGMPAGRIVRIMEMGYARSLGVDCTHCHVAGQWEKEDKTTKQTARDMANMVQTINGNMLKNIKNLRSPDPIINCTTCHRGQIKPALNL